MSDNNNAKESIPENEESYLALPIKKEELGKFISGLLGQPQSIERDINVNFDIDHAWVVNLHEIINQRIHQQACAQLTAFTFVIYFKDGLKRTITSFDAFKIYSETKKQIPVGIKIIWDYLIQFPTKNYPEKQQITFSAQIFPENARKVKLPKNIFRWLFFAPILETSDWSLINYQIDHTERTWGDDIEVIISNQVNDVKRGDQIKDTLFDVGRSLLALMVVIFCLTYPLSLSNSNASAVINKGMKSYWELNNNVNSTVDIVNKKLDIFAYVVQSYSNSRGGAYMLLSTIAAFPLAFLLLRLTRKSTYSFLVFSKEADKYRQKMLTKELRSAWILAGSFILSVLAGIIGNYGYTWLIK